MITILNCFNPLKAAGKVMTFKGYINSKISVSLWINIEKDIVYGQLLYYKASQKPIRIVGQASNGKISFDEFLQNGDITGSWDGSIDKNKFHGKWNSINGEKEMDFDLTQSADIFMQVDTSVISKNYVGRYEYHYGEEGYQGSMEITKKANHYYLTCSNVTKAPARNMADFEFDKLIISKGESICDLNGDNSCKFRIKYFKDFIIVSTIDNKYDCDFGFNAGVDGIYIKTE
jgi:hypothetical protein